MSKTGEVGAIARVALAALLLSAFAACSRAASPPKPVSKNQVSVTADPPCLPQAFERGMSFAHSWQRGGEVGYGSEASRASAAKAYQSGVRAMSVTPFGFMQSTKSDNVSHIGEMNGGERDALVEREIEALSKAGFAVMLKPHLWLHGGAWRGEIDPGSQEGWSRWFASYTKWIVHYASMAQAAKVDSFVVGVELRSTEKYKEHWVALIEEVRKVYRGKVLYAANWDSAAEVAFWDKLDAIGVQFYAPLASNESAGDAEIEANLRKHFDALSALHKDAQKPIVITELGYRPVASALVTPYEWPKRGESVVRDDRTRARAYRLVFAEMGRRQFVKGVYLWKWFSHLETKEGGPTGFAFRDSNSHALVGQLFRTCSK